MLATFPTEREAASFAAAVRRVPAPWQVDTVLAYLSVAVFYDYHTVHYDSVIAKLQSLGGEIQEQPGQFWEIPCCYDFGPDLAAVAEAKGLSPAGVIRLHSNNTYKIYAIGFVPGFPYMGYLADELQELPRLASPRVRVEAGSVGITGKQTAIYPLATPGGWQLIGRTPLELVHVADGYFPLRAGDSVRFVPITQEEFHRRQGERLPRPLSASLGHAAGNARPQRPLEDSSFPN